MTDTPDLSSPDRGWVSAWRDAVASSPCGAGLVDLASRTFLELSPTAAGLLEVPLDTAKGLDYLQVAERPEEAAMTFHLARQGLLDAIESRRRFTRRDG